MEERQALRITNMPYKYRNKLMCRHRNPLHAHTHRHTQAEALPSIRLSSLIRLGIINGGPVSRADSGVTLSLIPFSDNFIWPDAIVIAPVLDVYRKQ